MNRIEPTALPRSSIVISDEPLSSETNYRTEFVAVLNDQPKGGIITRKPVPQVQVANDERDTGYPGFNWDGKGRRERLPLDLILEARERTW